MLDILEQNGVYRCRPEYIEFKMEEFADYYKRLYSWYVYRAERIVPRPDPSVKYPIWVSLDKDTQLPLVEGTVALELEVDEDLLVVTDSEKWGYVMNFFYLPLDYEDLDRHNAELLRYGIGNETALTLEDKGRFYPIIKRKIEKSWERLFEDYAISNIYQATLWEIRREWVVGIRKGVPAND